MARASRSKTAAAAVWTWSAILGGVIASLIVQVLLTMLGLGIGLLSVDATTASNSPVGVTWAAFLWWTASGIFSAFIGGAVAGIHAVPGRQSARIAHALAAWAVAVLIVVGAASLTAGAAGITGAVAGPTSTAASRVQMLTRPGIANVTPAQIEQARQGLAGAMFMSFVGLLLGAGAAFAGGYWSEEYEG